MGRGGVVRPRNSSYVVTRLGTFNDAAARAVPFAGLEGRQVDAHSQPPWPAWPWPWSCS